MLSERWRELEDIFTGDRLVARAARGWCRVWSSRAWEEFERWATKASLEIKIEAREISMPSGVEHTFLRIVIAGFEPLLADGTGVEGKAPYFGPESTAPEHLKNSRMDTWIMIDKGCIN